MIQEKLKKHIRDVNDFPRLGIVFKDITPILQDAQLCREVVDYMCEQLKDIKVDAIAAVESRGFWFGMLLANKLNVPFVPVRKKGKLPYKTHSFKYDLEYGSAEVEMHIDSVKNGWNVVVHDDLLATGGTAAAAAELIQMQGGLVSCFSFLVALDFLNGQDKLNKYCKVSSSVVHY